jgi:hypothetical protein
MTIKGRKQFCIVTTNAQPTKSSCELESKTLSDTLSRTPTAQKVEEGHQSVTMLQDLSHFTQLQPSPPARVSIETVIDWHLTPIETRRASLVETVTAFSIQHRKKRIK